jgi:hypothetical protein
MNLLHEYKNGNYTVKLYSDGTKIRETDEDKFVSSFPENIDIKISDKCDAGCSFCHENSTSNGNIADFNYEFLYSLRPGTELAIGGGNVFENPKLDDFLTWCKMQGIVANITVNQIHFKDYYYGIFDWIDREKVYGVGVSYNGKCEELDEIFDGSWGEIYKENIVIHVINGVHSYKEIMKLANKGYKLLILGYKDLRRGHKYLTENEEDIKNNQQEIYENIHSIIKSFKVVSFDNLAIEQLNVRRLFTSNQWEEFYMGDDGSFTMYIDLVKGEFAKNSTSTVRYKLLPTIDEMFNVVKSESVDNQGL